MFKVNKLSMMSLLYHRVFLVWLIPLLFIVVEIKGKLHSQERHRFDTRSLNFFFPFRSCNSLKNQDIYLKKLCIYIELESGEIFLYRLL